MKLHLSAWKRTTEKSQVCDVLAVELHRDHTLALDVGEPMTWDEPLSAHGMITKVGLTKGGRYLAEFEFQEAELRNWLSTYIKADPAGALRLLNAMQAEAIVALSGALRPT